MTTTTIMVGHFNKRPHFYLAEISARWCIYGRVKLIAMQPAVVVVVVVVRPC